MYEALEGWFSIADRYAEEEVSILINAHHEVDIMAEYNFAVPLNDYFVPYVSYHGLFLPHELDRIDRLWRREESVEATLSGENRYDDELRQSSVMFLSADDAHRWIFDKLAMVAQSANMERYRFDLSGFFQELQLAEYAQGQFFDWHMDFGTGEISHRKLSLTLQLSDPNDYDGGTLQFMINQRIENAPKERGTIIVFPSFVMHRVTPVDNGVRRSVVGWVSGHPYR